MELCRHGAPSPVHASRLVELGKMSLQLPKRSDEIHRLVPTLFGCVAHLRKL